MRPKTAFAPEKRLRLGHLKATFSAPCVLRRDDKARARPGLLQCSSPVVYNSCLCPPRFTENGDRADITQNSLMRRVSIEIATIDPLQNEGCGGETLVNHFHNFPFLRKCSRGSNLAACFYIADIITLPVTA